MVRVGFDSGDFSIFCRSELLPVGGALHAGVEVGQNVAKDGESRNNP